MPHRETVDRQHQVGRCGAGDTGDIHQPVEVPVKLPDGGVDAVRIRQVDLDVAGYVGGGLVAVQAIDLRAGGKQSLCNRIPDA